MQFSLPRRQRILYVGTFFAGDTSRYRFHALGRLNQEVIPFDPFSYPPKGWLAQRLKYRYPVGPLVARVNRELVKAVQNLKPNVVWFDKPTDFTPETMRTIRGSGAKIVFYVQDSPFGPRKDGCWLQFFKTFQMADLHCLFRDADIPRYRERQLPFIKIMLSFDPLVHFPPPPEFSDTERNRQVSYIGSPYEQRPQFLLKLAREHQLPVFVNGFRWERVLGAKERTQVSVGGFLPDADYRLGIWGSKINLSFLTHDNEEDIGHKTVEVAACGGFLMAIRAPGHQAIFEEDLEAVFFSSVEECADKCRFYLNRPDLREAIAARGHQRAVQCGYDNDTQLARVLNRLDGQDA